MFDTGRFKGLFDQVVGPMSGGDGQSNRPRMPANIPRSVSRGSAGSMGTEGPDLGDEPQPEAFDRPDGENIELQPRKRGYGTLDTDRQMTVDEQSLDGDGAEGELGGKRKIGAWQAGWNVTNAIQGMFVVSLPYAVLHGGWWGVLSLVFVAYICYYTGLLLVECLYDDQGVRIRNSYKAVAESCWGRTWGGRLVLSAQMVELLMTCILYIVLCGDLLEGSFPLSTMDKMGWMMISTALLMPCAFLTDLRAVSWLSFWNAVSHVIINFVVLAYCLSQAYRWSFLSVRFSLNIATFPTVLGIVVFSYTSHIFLPTLEGSMMERTAFRPMLKWSHITAAIFKSLFGFVGFLTFGEYTQDEVTNNLPSQEFKAVLNVILFLKAVLSYPLPYFAAVELLEHQFFRGKPRTTFATCFSPDGGMREWALALRICLVLFTLFMAISIPHFALLMGLVGNITGTMLSFVWPCVFHLQLKRHTLTPFRKYCEMAVVAMGLTFGLVGIYYSSIQLSRAVTAVDEYN